MSTLLLYTCEKAVCLWLWGDDDRDASHHGLHAKHRRCTDHPCASPPPAGGLQNDTFLKAQLSKVWDEITSILFYFFLVAFLARLQLWRCHTNLKCKASVFFVFFSGAYFWRMSSAWRDFLLFARGLTWPSLSRALSLPLWEARPLLTVHPELAHRHRGGCFSPCQRPAARPRTVRLRAARTRSDVARRSGHVARAGSPAVAKRSRFDWLLSLQSSLPSGADWLRDEAPSPFKDFTSYTSSCSRGPTTIAPRLLWTMFLLQYTGTCLKFSPAVCLSVSLSCWQRRCHISDGFHTQQLPGLVSLRAAAHRRTSPVASFSSFLLTPHVRLAWQKLSQKISEVFSLGSSP